MRPNFLKPTQFVLYPNYRIKKNYEEEHDQNEREEGGTRPSSLGNEIRMSPFYAILHAIDGGTLAVVQ